MTDTDRVDLDAKAGYSSVDVQPDVAMVLAGMDATSAWPAVRRLRKWEHERLDPRPGDRLLDVGCGLGDVAMRFAADVRPGGHVVGMDASSAMLEVARRRADEAGVVVEFRQADAMTLDEPDASFDVCRSERVLQWLADPAHAVAEMGRVVRPGGRVCVTDTDWQTLTIDLPDFAAVSAFRQAVWNMRGASASAGSSLLNFCRAAGLVDLQVTAATHVWTRWDAKTEIAPAGIFPVAPIVRQLVEVGLLEEPVGTRFLDQLLDAASADRFFMSVTMFAVFGRRPP